MSGYSDFSKSNNAIEAESRDCYPASVLAKRLKVSTAAVTALMEPSEWHHTSKMYNNTDYYSSEFLLLLASGKPTDDYDEDDITEAAELLARLRAWKKPATTETVYTDCRVVWLEWGGTRARPMASEHTADGVTVTHKGGSFVFLAGGNNEDLPAKKKIGTRGLKITHDGSTIVDEYANHIQI